jgi:putative spermidine/putrescine transport system permease protein
MSARAKPEGLGQHLPLAYPALMLGALFLVPFGIMLVISFFHRVEGGFYEPAFDLANYERFIQAYFLRALAFSLFIAALAAAICVAVGFPFTFLLSRFRRRTQVLWLVFLMSVLSLSEVIIGFGWSVLLSRTAGVSNLLVAVGLMSEAHSWTPGFAAVLCGLCYIALPYTVLVLYPPLSRLDPELTEAARTLGASPLRTFFTVVVPARRSAILAALILAFVFTLGSYLLPQILGRPQEWTLSVLITDQAIYNSNLPFGAAMAVFLMAVSLALIGITLKLGRGERGALR